MSMARGSRMLRYINYRMRITLQDARVLVGTFMAFDRHMNIVLGDTQEFRKIRTKKTSGITEEKEEKRTLGLIILRGDSVVSMTIEGPPPPEIDEKMTPGGPGLAKTAAARGVPVAPAIAPGRGLTMGIVQPPTQVAAQVGAQTFPRGLPPPPFGMVPPPGMPRPPVAGMPPPGVGMPLPPRAPPGFMPPPGMPGMMPPRMPGVPGVPPPPRNP